MALPLFILPLFLFGPARRRRGAEQARRAGGQLTAPAAGKAGRVGARRPPLPPGMLRLLLSVAGLATVLRAAVSRVPSRPPGRWGRLLAGVV